MVPLAILTSSLPKAAGTKEMAEKLTLYGRLTISDELNDRFLKVKRRKNQQIDMRYKEGRELVEIDRRITSEAKEAWNKAAKEVRV